MTDERQVVAVVSNIILPLVILISLTCHTKTKFPDKYNFVLLTLLRRLGGEIPTPRTL